MQNDIEGQLIYLSQRQQERLFRKEVGMSPNILVVKKVFAVY